MARSLRYPRLGWYWTVWDAHVVDAPAETTLVDAADDVVELALDPMKVRARATNSEADAIWHFRFGFESHWGRHLRALQLRVHEIAFAGDAELQRLC